MRVVARKFTRKPKDEHREEPVIEPQSYPDVLSEKDALYKDYFLFWETWVDELSSFLYSNCSNKKQRSCSLQALDNLTKMRSLLKEDRARQLDSSIAEFTKIKDKIFLEDLLVSELGFLRIEVSRIKAEVHKNFKFSKIQKDML